ncbi:MAG: FISUMP domain-containing protein [Bacteroidota bacterium]|jgi:uncharacterized protein (TIGR02145 family)
MKKILITVSSLLALQAKSQFIKDTVKIGEQIWSTSILDVSTFRNGDSIFFAATHGEWIECDKLKIPAYCYVWDSVELGKHYNWYAVNDYRGLAPAGWRIPSKNDAKYLFKYFEETINPKHSLLEKFPMKYLGYYSVYNGNYSYYTSVLSIFNPENLAIYYWLSSSHEDESYSDYSYVIGSFKFDDEINLRWTEKGTGNCVLLLRE